MGGLALLLCGTPANAQSVWSGTISASYNNSLNWVPTLVPNSSGEAALFNNSLVGSGTVDLGGATVSPDSWTIIGLNTFTFQNGTVSFSNSGGLTVGGTADQNIGVNLDARAPAFCSA
ncbi:hypothetical protein [Methyloligella halotolerans]|uniref:hypothetical protein n=1 Tax=Methyloligella halotolerans TaxID=1177755 RepID=UPI00083CE53B|nr:hypothetical protein [Methyloligella halotolerans]